MGPFIEVFFYILGHFNEVAIRVSKRFWMSLWSSNDLLALPEGCLSISGPACLVVLQKYVNTVFHWVTLFCLLLDQIHGISGPTS